MYVTAGMSPLHGALSTGLAATLLAASHGVATAQAEHMVPVARLGGAAWQVETDDQSRYAYVGQWLDGGLRLGVWDLQHRNLDRPDPVLVGQSDVLTGVSIDAMAIAGPRAYVVTGPGWLPFASPRTTLAIVDIGQPEAPRVVGSVEVRGVPPFVGGRGYDLVVNDTWAYLLHSAFGLVTISVAEPTHPVVMRPERLTCCSGSHEALALTMDRLYVAGNSLAIYDIAEPGDPRLLPNWLPSPRPVKDLKVLGSRLYGVGRDLGLWLLDVSDRDQPATIETLEQPGQSWNAIAVIDPFRALLAGPAGLDGLHISQPGRPGRTSRTALPGESTDILLLGDLVAVAAGDGGLIVLRAEASPGPLPGPRPLYLPLAVQGGCVGANEACPIGPLPAWGGAATAVHVIGPYALVGRGAALLVVALPRRPPLTVIGEIQRLPGPIRDLDAEGTMAYAIVDSSGKGATEGHVLAAIDVGEPSAPRLLGSLRVPASSRIEVRSGFAYLATAGGVVLVDVRDPYLLKLVTWSHRGSWVADLAIDGGRMLAIEPARGLSIFDLSRPDYPVETAVLPRLPGWDGRAALAVRGSRAFVAVDHDDFAGEIALIDIGVQRQPRRIGTSSLWGQVLDVTTAGDDHIVVSERQGSIRRLEVFDVASETPILIAAIELATGREGPVLPAAARGLAAIGDRLLVADGPGGLRSLDLTRSPIESAVAMVSPSVDDVAHMSGRLLVAAPPSGAVVLNSESLAELGTFDSGLGPVAVALRAPDGGEGYVLSADAAVGGLGTLHRVSLAEPSQPVSLGAFHGGGWTPLDFAVKGAVAVLGEGRGIRVVWLSGSAMRDLARIGDIEADRVLVDANVLLALSAYNGLSFVDLSNPSAPILVARLRVSGTSLAHHDGYVYVADGRQLHVINGRNPRSPYVHRSLATAAKALAVGGNRLYAADVALTQFDISDPSAPVVSGIWNVPGAVRRMAVDGQGTRVWLAAGESGLFAWDAPPTTP
jgi:hypothetical protein